LAVLSCQFATLSCRFATLSGVAFWFLEPVLHLRIKFLLGGLGFGGWGLGSGVWGLGIGFWGWGSGFRVQGVGFRVQGSGCRVQGVGFRGWGWGGTPLPSSTARPPPSTRARDLLPLSRLSLSPLSGSHRFRPRRGASLRVDGQPFDHQFRGGASTPPHAAERRGWRGMRVTHNNLSW